MICPACGYEMRYPTELSFTPDHPLRQYECVKCGWSGESVETWREPEPEPTNPAQTLRALLWKITYEKRMEAKDENPGAGS